MTALRFFATSQKIAAGGTLTHINRLQPKVRVCGGAAAAERMLRARRPVAFLAGLDHKAEGSLCRLMASGE
jgi:hypothetical protein